MKTVREVYQKLREVKQHHLVKLYKQNLSKRPENCRYNYPYSYKKEKNIILISLCFLHQPEENFPKERELWPYYSPKDTKIYPHLLDICQEAHHSTHCNAFVLRYTKEEIKKKFDLMLTNQKFKEKEYADICALEWVLSKSILEIAPLNWIQKIYIKIKKILSKNRVL